MKNLKTESSKLYAYVAFPEGSSIGIVWKINKQQDENDKCCIEMTSDNCNLIDVKYKKIDGSDELVTYYLDVYVQEGDFYDSASSAFTPNNDHRLDFSNNPYDNYIDIYRDEAIEEVFDATESGEEFASTVSSLPLYLQYSVGTKIENDFEYSEIIESNDIAPITKNDDRVVEYFVQKAKEHAVACANDVLKNIDKAITTDDVIIEDKNADSEEGATN